MEGGEDGVVDPVVGGELEPVAGDGFVVSLVGEVELLAFGVDEPGVEATVVDFVVAGTGCVVEGEAEEVKTGFIDVVILVGAVVVLALADRFVSFP